MALIMLALGVCGIGVILVAAFFDDTTMLGIGIALAILGAAGCIMGCIHRSTMGEYGTRASKGDGKPISDSVAPERIPSPSVIIDHDRSFDGIGADKGLYYEPCSVSPPRPHRNGDGMLTSPAGGVVIPMDFAMDGVMSPYQQRSFPVPMSPKPTSRTPSAFIVPKEWETPGRKPAANTNSNSEFYSPYDR
eukprot:GILI01032965.1.p1 GENE.GILI01032965.1~~GILI01032965.1.p1  ORF type:complete len:212 (+),score=33.36 GILI01032965.1:64-636(+)